MTNKPKREETIRNKAFVINPFKFPEFKGEDGLIRVSDVEGIIEAELKAQMEEIIREVEGKRETIDTNLYADVDERLKSALMNHDKMVYNTAINDAVTLIRNKIGV